MTKTTTTIKMGFDTIEINLVENVFSQRKEIWLILFVKWEESWNVYMSLCPEPFVIQSWHIKLIDS